MLPLRRRTALSAALAPIWALLVVVAAAPVAQADTGGRDAPHDPTTYYAGTEGLTGNALALMLNSIIDGHTFIPYTAGTTDVWDAMDDLDRDPNDPTRIIDAYSGDSLAASNKCGSSCPLDGWNREHTWSQSRGSFNTDSSPGTDLFHMRPLRGNTNSSRGNKDFDNGGAANVPGCPVVCKADGDSFEPRNAIKGDIARGLFYMDVRYNGDADDQYAIDLRMWDQTGNSGSQIGKLSTLVAWSLADPPDTGERARNDRIDSFYQHNRNPFIDHPEWVCAIWGSSNPAACSNTNQPPTITSPSTKSTPRDTPFALPLTATDPNGDPLTWSVVAPAATHGTASIIGSAPNFSLSYTPAAGYSGPDSVGVQVSDGNSGIATVTIQITVTAVNQPPTVEDIGADTPIMVPKFNSKQIALLGNDPEGHALTYSLVTPPGRGTVTINGNVATYTTSNSSGTDGFTYSATDPSNAQSEPGEVTVSIGSSPNAPILTPVSATTGEDEATTFTLTANDPDGDVLTYTINSQPTKGSVIREGDEVVYTPTLNATGSDSFGWSVSDGTNTESSTATITITPFNDAPVATPGSLTTAEDTVKNVTLGAGDAESDPLTYAIFTQPAHGSVTLNGATATYTPVANYHGPDTFSFKASDASTSSAAASISVTVTPANDAPTATAVTTTTAEDTAKAIALNGNDVDGDSLTYGVSIQPGHGSVVVSGTEATYTPAANYHGTDTFSWTVSDGSATISRSATVTVTPVNDAPTAGPVSKSGPEGSDLIISLGGVDVDGDALTYALVDLPAHGDVVIAGDQATYTPDPDWHGGDTFTYTAADAALTSAKATISVTVTPVNDPPTVDAASLDVTAGSSVSQALTTADIDGDTVTITSATTPAHGSVTFTGTEVTYTPAVRSGTDSFTVTVSDGNGGTGSAVVDVQITARTATLSLSTPAATRGKPVTTTITASGSAGPKPGGLVTLKRGPTTLGTATLGPTGTATVTWTPTSAGVIDVVASYDGDNVFDPAASAASQVAVAKSAPTFAFSGKVKRGKKGKVVVTIGTVAGQPPTGTVTLQVGPKTFTAVLSGGKATFKIGKVPNKKKLKVTATYGGDGQYSGGSASNSYKLN